MTDTEQAMDLMHGILITQGGTPGEFGIGPSPTTIRQVLDSSDSYVMIYDGDQKGKGIDWMWLGFCTRCKHWTVIVALDQPASKAPNHNEMDVLACGHRTGKTTETQWTIRKGNHVARVCTRAEKWPFRAIRIDKQIVKEINLWESSL
jgi:hypothetical protein